MKTEKHLADTRLCFGTIGWVCGSAFMILDGYWEFIVFPVYLFLYVVVAWVLEITNERN